MTKAEFSKKAMAKYKAVNDSIKKSTDWVDEMNFTYSPDTIFRVWYDPQLDNGKGKVPGGYMHRWCSLLTLEAEDRKLIRQAGQILSADTDEELAVMIGLLRKALKTDPELTVDYVDGVQVWQNVELSFTVKAACEYIGIK